MRCTLLLVVLAVVTGCAHYRVYSVKENPSLPVGGGVVYALPKTLLRVDVTVERRDLSAAIYRDYATEMLGVESALVDSNYRIVDIEVSGVNVADPEHLYFVRVNRGSVTVNDKHLLLAIGMQPDSVGRQKSQTRSQERYVSQPVRAEFNLYDRADTFYTRNDRPGHPSMVSTRKDTRSVKQRAQAAAERLEEIQTKKAELIEGEYEGAYSAEAVQYLYDQLCRQESTVITDFCGTLRRETVSFFVAPRMKKGTDFYDTITWFSPEDGFQGSEESISEGAFPLVCQVLCDNELRSAGRFVKYYATGTSSGRKGKGFRYRVPEQVEVTVYASDFSVRRNVLLSQLGPTVSLPKRRIKAQFDVETFDLKHMER